MNRLTAAIALALLLSSSHGEETAPREKPPEPVVEKKLPFTWGNDVPAYVDRGASAYEGGDFSVAEEDFRNAQLLRPDLAEPIFNLGLAAARQNEPQTAIDHFNRALDLARDNDALRAEALYNRGIVQFDQARAALDGEKPNRAGAIQNAISALDSFRQAQTVAPDFSDAELNRQLVQQFLREIPLPPPQQEQQQQQDGDENDQQEQQENQQQQQQPQPQDPQENQDPQNSPNQNDPQQNPDGGQNQDPQEQRDPQQQENEQQQEAQDKPEEAEGQPEEEEQQQGEQPQSGQAQQMSPEDAKRLLNLLGNKDMISLSLGRNRANKPDPEKDW